jgi:pyruvate/2-oxoglutarate dehydrogenase complex dihydrolipoamide dehydrogenase (E3) component
MAQAFRRLGSEVHLLERSDHFLPREESDAAAVLREVFAREGVRIHLRTEAVRVARDAGGVAQVVCRTPAGETTLAADALLVAAGRRPNVEGLGLEAAGVAYDERHGIRVDDRLRTSNRRVYAAGDVCMRYKFTHAADAAARLLLQNALFMGRRRLSALTIPWTTYTEPEIAHVGLYPEQAAAEGLAVDVFTRELAEVDRAVCDGETEGYVRLYARRGTDRILGGTIVAGHAGEMIGEVCLAMQSGAGLGALSAAVHPYPTQAEAIRQTGDAYRRTRLTPWVRRLMRAWLRWRRS